MSLQIDDINDFKPSRFPLFALGFRPFFLLAALSSIVIMSLSLIQFSQNIRFSSYYSSIDWHAHEMLFAYSIAVVAGFLLTAVGNWTGSKMIKGWPLAGLVFVFLLGRITPLIPDISPILIALSDFIFIPLLTVLIAMPIIGAKQWSNLIFIPLLGLMALANLMVHLSALGMIALPIEVAHRTMLYLLIFMIVMMGGRVIPFFTKKGVQGSNVKEWKWVETLSSVSIVMLLIADVFYGNSILTACIAFLTAGIQAIRLFGWYSLKIWQVPLVWVLHLAYAWLVVAFIMQGLSALGFNLGGFFLHGLTAGVIGVMTLGMMARVSLGHTGREMKLDKVMALSFILINVAVFIRVVFPVFFRDSYMLLIQLAGWLWVAVFMIFFVKYLTVWLHPRVDGREG